MENPVIFVDDSSTDIIYSGSQWTVDTVDSNNTFGGSQHVYRTDSAPPGNLTFSFLGKSLEIYGTFDSAMKMTSELDGATYTSLDSTTGVAPGTRGVQVFDLGVLSGPHTVVVLPIAGQLTVDYLVYAPSGVTKFDGERLVYDDTNPTLNFTGAWTPISNLNISALPFNDTLISTTQKGSSFAIGFVGSSISVYGAFNPAPGLVSATFSIDGSSPAPLQVLNRSATASDWSLYQSFFQQNFNDSTETTHILNVTVVDASEAQPFFLDYVMTTGNKFTALEQKPFEKSGSQLKSTGVKIGLIILGIALGLFAWIAFSKWRTRRKRTKGGGAQQMIPVELKRQG